MKGSLADGDAGGDATGEGCSPSSSACPTPPLASSCPTASIGSGRHFAAGPASSPRSGRGVSPTSRSAISTSCWCSPATDVSRPRSHNDVLLRLVELAREDDLAARIVIQRLLPGLLSTARRRRPGRDIDGALEELIGATWLAIEGCRTDRRPDTSPPTSSATPATARSPRRGGACRPTRWPSTPGRSTTPPRRRSSPRLRGARRLLADARAAGFDDGDLELVRDLARPDPRPSSPPNARSPPVPSATTATVRPPSSAASPSPRDAAAGSGPNLCHRSASPRR